MSEREPQLGGAPDEPERDTATPPPLPEPAPVERAVDADAGEHVIRLGYADAQRVDEVRGEPGALGDRREERELGHAEPRGASGVEDELVGEVHERQGYGAGEKIASVVRMVMERPPPGDARARAAWRALGIVRRLGILDAFVALFPPIDDHRAWDERIGLFVGVALNLASDGVELDLDACRYNGAALLRSLYE